MTQPTRVLCLGGGWGAANLIKPLRKAMANGEIELTVVSRENFHTFHGFIAEMLTGRIQPGSIVNPARRIFRGAQFHLAEVAKIDLEAKRVVTSRYLDGKQYELEYDHLVLSLGMADDLSRYPGIAEHAMKLKTYWDCFKVRNHLLSMLELAEIEPDPDERRRLLTFVVVGGNFGGIEVAAELVDYFRILTRREYPRLDPDEIRVVVVSSSERILPEIVDHQPKLVAYAEQYLAGIGLEILTGTRISAATNEEAFLDGGTSIHTRTIISCAGGTVAPVLSGLPVEKDRQGRVRTDRYMRVLDADDVWAVGDCAAVPHPKGGVCPTVAIHAMAGGRRAGSNVLRVLDGRLPKPYRFTGLGDACSLGRRRAVANLKGVRLYGISAWVLWRAVFLGFVPTWDRRFRILFDWFLTPLVGREVVEVRMQEPLGVRKEVFQPGQAVIRQGDLGQKLYLIWEGQAEVVQTAADGDRLLATLSRGDHFGEQAVFGGVRRNATVRAKTQLEVLSLGAPEALAMSEALPGLGDHLRRLPDSTGDTGAG